MTRAFWLSLLALARVAPGVAQSASLSLIGLNGEAKTLSPAELAALPQQEIVVVERDSTRAIFRGPALRTLVGMVGAPEGHELRGPNLLIGLLAEASDGYRVAYMLAELDPELGGRSAILALTRDGKPLVGDEGPFRIIQGGEAAHRARWIRQVIRLRLVNVTAPGVRPGQDTGVARDSFVVASRALGENRLINVHLPAGYESRGSERFPVLYMPDGGLDEDFPHVVQTVDSLTAAGAIRPVIVVGVPNTERRRDLTGPTRVHSDSAIAPRVGGSAAFRRFLRNELLPAIDARYRTTKERAIVGESLAGLFIVEVFLLEPSLFTRYVAFDPSLWWNRSALLDTARNRLAELPAGPRSLYLSSSSQDIDANSTRFAQLLRGVPTSRLNWVFVPRPDFTHATIFRGMEAVALAAALR